MGQLLVIQLSHMAQSRGLMQKVPEEIDSEKTKKCLHRNVLEKEPRTNSDTILGLADHPQEWWALPPHGLGTDAWVFCLVAWLERGLGSSAASESWLGH